MYKEFLKNGKSEGDNLLGFLFDLEYYLEELEGVSNVSVRSTDDEENLLVASFKFAHDISEKEMADRLKNTWLDCLSYASFEKHSFVLSQRKVEFYFCTISSPIGVTGKIVGNGT
ncbi:hypothetical protein ISG33_14525 [Glaciecola sp. MH2013]|uniref:hypothetical protein n=1 Tax=Glaciecola sp. MH2013 TaxID=2785524 RepID=UPI00189D6645|nr:hypothetical protein [Glaciecola sp. MH2013]MBF7074618.1 hypothetical protein [Glaciecola sp. MH2013]